MWLNSIAIIRTAANENPTLNRCNGPEVCLRGLSISRTPDSVANIIRNIEVNQVNSDQLKALMKMLPDKATVSQ